MTTNPFIDLDKTLTAESATSHETAELMYHLFDRIGPRFPGTPGYKRAADFMLAKFTEYGLENAHLEPFEFLCWKRGEPATFTLTAPFTRDYPCYALPYCGATAAGGVTAGIVDVGTGSLDEFETAADAVKGNIILTSSSSGHRTDIYNRAVEFGAVGFVYYSTAPGMLLPTGTVGNGEEGTIPAIGICHETNLEIKRLGERDTLSFNLTTDCSYDTETTWNIVGDIPGSEPSDEWVIVGGHLDSHDIGPCAYDNGAGAVQIMETARLMAHLKGKLKRPVRFIGFAAEEIGLLGSHYHAKANAERLKSARFMVNVDMPGLGWPKGVVSHKCAHAKDYITHLSEQMATPIHFVETFHSHSDHYPFILQGIPTFGVGSGPQGSGQTGLIHTIADTADKISVIGLRDSACFAAKLLVRAANDESWPIPRRSVDEIKKLHTDKGIPFPSTD